MVSESNSYFPPSQAGKQALFSNKMTLLGPKDLLQCDFLRAISSLYLFLRVENAGPVRCNIDKKMHLFLSAPRVLEYYTGCNALKSGHIIKKLTAVFKRDFDKQCVNFFLHCTRNPHFVLKK